MIPGRSSFRAAALLLALAFSAAAAPAAAQDPAAAADTTTSRLPTRPAATGTGTGERGPLLDAPVSRTQYPLGPGDVVDVAIFGDYNEVFSIPVTPEGSLVVPTIGIARVLGLNLDAAEGRVQALVNRYYRNADVRLALSRVRTFKVFVVGDVPVPGTREASAATRVSEVLPSEERGAPVVRRNVTLRRAGGEEMRLDLRRFLQTGDVASNPTLREGDAVIVPTVDERVDVLGRLRFPGQYEYRPGETLAQLLEVANGAAGFLANAADTVRLVRFLDTQNRTEHVFTRAQAAGPEGQRFVLRPFDAVYVPEVGNFKRQQSATVQGAVMRPGIYPIRQDTTTVRDLVEMAGGFAPNASLTEATLRRSQPAASNRSSLQNVPAELLSEDERRLLQVQAQGDASTVVVDFENLFAAGAQALDVPVRNGDLLSVPESRNQVTVLGGVRTPGILPYQPGQTVSYYIRLAGGYSRNADASGVRVVKARQGTPMHWRDVPELEAGDTVIVPFSERRNWLAMLQGLQAVIGTVSGILLGILALRQI
ncbi:SLBB domain-containing protein [Longimicrobium sp.]|uniref:SLBB domain-containing protein n=1 Tax=Longimicrobium sp. TaxID=2029185 RepID=UPI003B3BBF09